jgi:hypothetical protein
MTLRRNGHSATAGAGVDAALAVYNNESQVTKLAS